MDSLSGIEDQFPTLANNKELAYFDSAASTQTHNSVLAAMNHYYEHERSNVHRGDYAISRSVSDKVETAREQVAELINAKPEQILFTAGATEGINIVADWFEGADVVFITDKEHSANIMPWLAQGRNVDNGRLVVLETTPDGNVDTATAIQLFDEHKGKRCLLSMIAISNVSGVVTNWKLIGNIAKTYHFSVCIDACQTVGSHKFDSSSPVCDFAVFSAHKMYGPTGTGVLYCKHDTDLLRPVRLGGGAVMHYDFSGNVEWVSGPSKHEPGTPNIAGIIGTGVAAEWISYVGYDAIQQKLSELNQYLSDAGLFDIPNMVPVCKQRSLNGIQSSSNIHSFILNGVHPSDVGALLGNNNVAVRAGKLCAHPYVNALSSNGVLRVSLGVYNTEQDCKKLVEELWNAMKRLT